MYCRVKEEYLLCCFLNLIGPKILKESEEQQFKTINLWNSVGKTLPKIFLLQLHFLFPLSILHQWNAVGVTPSILIGFYNSSWNNVTKVLALNLWSYSAGGERAIKMNDTLRILPSHRIPLFKYTFLSSNSKYPFGNRHWRQRIFTQQSCFSFTKRDWFKSLWNTITVLHFVLLFWRGWLNLSCYFPMLL